MSFYNGVLNYSTTSATGQRGLPGIGFKLDGNNNYDIQNKKLVSSIGDGGFDASCAKNPTRKKCAKTTTQKNTGLTGNPKVKSQGQIPRSNISGMPRSNFPRSNGKV